MYSHPQNFRCFLGWWVWPYGRYMYVCKCAALLCCASYWWMVLSNHVLHGIQVSRLCGQLHVPGCRLLIVWNGAYHCTCRSWLAAYWWFALLVVGGQGLLGCISNWTALHTVGLHCLLTCCMHKGYWPAAQSSIAYLLMVCWCWWAAISSWAVMFTGLQCLLGCMDEW